MKTRPNAPSTPRTLIVDMVNGPKDGETLISHDEGLWPRLGSLSEADEALCAFLDTNDGEVGRIFTAFRPKSDDESCKYPILGFVTSQGNDYLAAYRFRRFNNHRYRITDRLEVDCEVLVKAEHVRVVSRGSTYSKSIIKRCNKRLARLSNTPRVSPTALFTTYAALIAPSTLLSDLPARRRPG